MEKCRTQTREANKKRCRGLHKKEWGKEERKQIEKEGAGKSRDVETNHGEKAKLKKSVSSLKRGTRVQPPLHWECLQHLFLQ